MTPEQLLEKVKSLEWTQEVRQDHPWSGDILVRKSDVEALIRGAAETRLTNWRTD